MKPAPFTYHAPETLEAAYELLARGDTAPLAGGQSLVPALSARSMRPAAVMDLAALPGLDGVEDLGDRLRVGARTTLDTLARSPLAARRTPLLSRAAGAVGHLEIRLRATLGGTLCHADPAAQVPCAAVALGAVLTLGARHTRRTVPAAEFFLGPYRTARRPDELLLAAEFPTPPGWRYAFAGAGRRGMAGFPMSTLCLAVRSTGPLVREARIAGAGATDHTMRLHAAEARLVGRPLHAGVEEAAAAAADSAVTRGIDADAAQYRRHLLSLLLRRAAADLEGEEDRV
jgi:carbon-monoxide dehydrogenase medium subunit